RLSAVLGAERASRRDGDEHPVRVLRIEQDGVHGHAARAGLPEMPLGAAQAGQFLPGLAAVHRFEDRRVLRSGVNGVWLGERRLQMPDALEFPRMLRA